nr:MAG TPA: hypothetical protein [Caudoviricetes sp.]
MPAPRSQPRACGGRGPSERSASQSGGVCPEHAGVKA